MLTINIGPLALSTAHVLLLLSLLLATFTGWYVGRRGAVNPEKQLFRLLLVAMLVARVAFVAVYLEHYREQPWQMLDIRDGGFIAWPGLLAALLLGTWLAWRTQNYQNLAGQRTGCRRTELGPRQLDPAWPGARHAFARAFFQGQ